MAVISLAHEVQAKTEAVDMDFLRSRQSQPPVRRVCRVVEIHRLVGSVARGDALDLEAEDVGDRDRALQARHIELDRLELNTAEITDQMLADEPWRSTCLAADNRGECAPLRRV